MRNRIFYGAILLLAVAIVAYAGVAFAQANTPEPEDGSEPVRTLTVSGTGKAFLTPDIAYIYIGVQTQGKDATEAVAENSTNAQKITDALRAAGVAAKDLRTTNFSIYPQTQYDKEGQPTGEILYIVNNTVYVTVREVAEVGSLLDAAVEAGANSINGISFDVSDRTAALSEARKAAVTDARAVAEELAEAAGVELGEIQSINVSSSGGGSPIYYERAAMDAAGASVPVSAGEMEISVNVNIVYAIR